MKRVALYIRVSSDQQVKFGDSLREQEDTLNEYVKTQKDMIIHSTYIDDGISGQKLERDEFNRLMNDIKNGLVDLILFTKLDRWFRSLKHYLNTQEVLEKNNVHWIAVSQPYYDTTTAYGRTFINQVMSFAELEAQMTSERMKSVFSNKVKMGEVISGSTPLGYSIVDKHLVPNEQADIVRSVFNYYIEYANLNQTSLYLLEEFGIARTMQAVRSMLKNKKYIGEFRENKNYCEPIITKELFESVNRQLDMNQKSNVKNVYLFSGLLVCGKCGRKMNSGQKATWGNRRKDGTRIKYPPKSMYSCRYAYQHPKCTNTKTIREHVLEKKLLEMLDDSIREAITELKNVKENIPDIRKKQQSIERKIDRLKVAYLNEIISLAEFKQDKEKLVKELNDLSSETRSNSDEQRIENLEKLLKMNVAQNYNKMDLIEKKAFWRSFIKKIKFNADREISMNFL
ncbi:recombinase family protein [Enterococcus faecium]|uniref:recombinase family protein n=1 Tax=Enterococcus faecium TaxID=1352 RepID=UPI002221A3A8|nr:recombinase family protein [Enterococcus faecium]MCW1818543.1 recombinase family protein [Enterococcus faecium]